VANFANDIEKAAGREKIKSIVIGGCGNGRVSANSKAVPKAVQGVLLSWEEARIVLDYEYDKSYGRIDCHAIYAWTATKVLFIGQYDGATWVASVPRKPSRGVPEFEGGGG